MGGSKKVTVGYKYYLGMHMVVCAGPVDLALGIRADNKVAWTGSVASGSIAVSAENLFGGEDGNQREGGIGGTVDFCSGGPTQTPNSYLSSKLPGGIVPAFRLVAAFVLRQCYVGMNPYLKRWSFRLQRIHTRQNGLAQWYDSKAAIVIDGTQTEVVLYVGNFTPTFNDQDEGADYIHDNTMTIGPFNAQRVELRAGDPANPGAVNVTRLDTGIVVNGTGKQLRNVDADVNPTTFPGYSPFGQVIWRGSVNGNMVLQCWDKTLNPDGITYTLGNGAVGALGPFHVVSITGQYDMNPAHIIRECLTDPDWGMGYNEADIDDVAFMAAADTLFSEGMGISLLWTSEIEIGEFITEVLKHIEASLYVDRKSGKFVLKLVRDDYDPNTLLELGEDQIDKVEDFKRAQFGELTTSVSVKYWDGVNNVEGMVSVQDIALEKMQGAAINTATVYHGFQSAALALRAAQRDLRTLSSQLCSCTIYADRTAKDLQVGDVFRLTWPDYGITKLVMRVAGIAYGDGRNNRIRINAAEDVFRLDDLPLTAVNPPAWEDPGGPAQVAARRKVYEVPYVELVQQNGVDVVTTALTTDPLHGNVGAAAGRPGAALNALLETNAGTGFEAQGILDFCPTAQLTANVDRITKLIPIDNGIDLDLVTIGTWCQIGNEIMEVEALTSSLLTVGRSVLDTVPENHLDNDYVLFWDALSGTDPTLYAQGESVDVKILTQTGSGQLALADAPTDTIVLNARAIRPYPPGNVKLNGEYFPAEVAADVVITWAHRDRLGQGTTLVDFLGGSTGPEAGTTYKIVIKDDTAYPVRTVTGISGTTYTYTSAFETADGGPFTSFTIELSSVRDGYESYQKHSITVSRPAPYLSIESFVPNFSLEQPIPILWNDNQFIVSVAGIAGDFNASAIGFYRIPEALPQTPVFLGANYDGRLGPSGDYIPKSAGFPTYDYVTRTARPLFAGGVPYDPIFTLFWPQLLGGGAASQWLITGDDQTPSIKISDTTKALSMGLNENLVAIARKANGNIVALRSGSPASFWKSTSNGLTWSNQGLTNIGAEILATYEMFEMADGSLFIPNVGRNADGNGLTWTSGLITDAPGDLTAYTSYAINDIAYDGTAIVAVAEYIQGDKYKTEVLADSPVLWLRGGEDELNVVYGHDSVAGNNARFAPGVGVTGAGVSHCPGLVGAPNQGLIGAWAYACVVDTYWEPRTPTNSAINFFNDSGDFTIEFWHSKYTLTYPSSTLPQGIITMFSQNKLLSTTGWFSQIVLLYDPFYGTLRLVIRGYSSNPALFGPIECDISGSAGVDLFDGNPHHIVVTRGTGGRVSIYVDNVVRVNRASGTISDLQSGSLAAGTIFGNVFGSNSTHYFSTIDEMALYRSELSSARVSAHYNAGLASGDARNMIFRSTDNAQTWTKIRDVAKVDDAPPGYAFAMKWDIIVPFNGGFAIYGKSDFAGAFPYVMLSTDHGLTFGTPTRLVTSDPTDNAVVIRAIASQSRVLATLTTKIVSGSHYPQFAYSTDGIHFTDFAVGSFPIGPGNLNLILAEDQDTNSFRFTETGDLRITE